MWQQTGSHLCFAVRKCMSLLLMQQSLCLYSYSINLYKVKNKNPYLLQLQSNFFPANLIEPHCWLGDGWGSGGRGGRPLIWRSVVSIPGSSCMSPYSLWQNHLSEDYELWLHRRDSQKERNLPKAGYSTIQHFPPLLLLMSRSLPRNATSAINVWLWMWRVL